MTTSLFDHTTEPIRFDGANYSATFDKKRLTGQLLRVFNLMRDGVWRTLDSIAATTGDPAASISAQLRHLRKKRFGAHDVQKRRHGKKSEGLFEYRLLVNTKGAE